MTDTARELRRLARVLERNASTAEAAAIAWRMAATGLRDRADLLDLGTETR